MGLLKLFCIIFICIALGCSSQQEIESKPYTTNELIDYHINLNENASVVVTGVVESIDHINDTDFESGANSKIIALNLATDRKRYLGERPRFTGQLHKVIRCEFDQQTDKFNQIKVGDKVTIAGIYDGLNVYHDVWVKESSLLNSTQ
jgi:hypothetical protein